MTEPFTWSEGESALAYLEKLDLFERVGQAEFEINLGCQHKQRSAIGHPKFDITKHGSIEYQPVRCLDCGHEYVRKRVHAG